MAWQEIAAKKKAAQTELVKSLHFASVSVPADVLNVSKVPLDGVLSKLDLEITETADVGALLANIANRKWTSVAVIGAYCRRAIIAHELTNCLTEIFIDRAMARARELDDHLAKTGKVIGPLHGLPISLKDQVNVEGVETNMGYVGWVGQIATKNAVLADILIQQGAVLYVKTNVPTSLMLPEARNAVWGKTSNPFNRNLTCGGSSGGEGALIAMKGSPLGVGSDIGGSIRIPAAFNGIYGLRPSYHRVPYEGAANSMQGFEAVPSVLGPLSSSVNGLKIFFEAVLGAKPWDHDPLVLRRPWSEEAYNLRDHGGAQGKLCFALMKDDGICLPMPPYMRALRMTKAALEKEGHKVVEWDLPNGAEGLKLLNGLYTADGGEEIASMLSLSGEPPLDSVLVHEVAHLTTYEYWQLCLRRREYLKKQLDAWQATVSLTGTGRPFDGVIAPPSANCPELHGKPQHFWWTGQCNIADYSTGVFPVTAVDPAVDVKVPAHEFRSKMDKDVYESYEPETYRDAPISLQIIGQKGEEEAVIRMVEIIDAALKST